MSNPTNITILVQKSSPDTNPKLKLSSKMTLAEVLDVIKSTPDIKLSLIKDK